MNKPPLATTKKIKLFVFDWDGTLVDSVAKIIACKQVLAKRYAVAVPSETTIKAVIGMDFKAAMQKCFPDIAPALLKEISSQFHALMKLPEYQASLFPHAKTVLTELRKRGFHLAVATSKARQELDVNLKHNAVTEMFDIICCSEEFKSKPHPRMLQYILASLNFAPSETIMVGDTPIDVEFARNADIPCICINSGTASKQQLSACHPCTIIDNISELLKIKIT